MLDFCRECYPALWRSYAGSTQIVTPDRFVSLLRTLKGVTASADFAGLERDLAWLAKRLYKAGFRLFPERGRKAAYAEFTVILRGGSPPRGDGRALAHPAEGPTSGAPPPRGSISTGGGDSAEQVADAVQPDHEVASPVRPLSLSRGEPAPEPDAGDGNRGAMPLMPRPETAWVKGSLTLVCVKVTDEARDVKTFSFAHKERAWFCYQPGQFLTIEPVIDGKTVPRPYTISSTPTRPGLLEITVKRAPGGVVSNWLHDHMLAGGSLAARGPFGNFTCLNFRRDKYLFLSAGSGITPLMSMLRYLHDLAASVDLVFFHSAGTQDDLVFRNELILCGERNPRLHIQLSLTGEPADRKWEGLRGRLDNAMLQQIAPDFMERAVLACGPPGFMEKAKQLLAGNGFPLETQFDQESFVPKATRPADRPSDGASARKSTVVFARSGKSAEISMDDTILDAALRCSIDIPSACRQGRCGTCRATKLSGEILMPEQEALTPEEIAQGEILTCVGQPRSAIVEVEA